MIYLYLSELSLVSSLDLSSISNSENELTVMHSHTECVQTVKSIASGDVLVCFAKPLDMFLAETVTGPNSGFASNAVAWESGFKGLDAIFRLNRRQVKIVNVLGCKESAKTVADQNKTLEEVFKLVASKAESVDMATLGVASLWMQNNPELAVLNSKLQAMSHGKHLFSTAELEAAVATISKHRGMLSEYEEAKKSSAQEVEKLNTKLTEVSSLLSERVETAKQLENKKTQLTESNAKLKEENNLILDQLMTVQQAIEDYSQKVKASNQQKDSNARKLEDARKELLRETRRGQRDNALLNSAQQTLGWKLGKISRGLVRVYPKKKFAEQVSLLNSSDLFDTEWYLAEYADVAEAGADPALHYLRHGAAEGRNPSPNFDTNWYLHQYPDVEAAALNPLIHYILYGIEEARKVSPRLLAHYI